MNMPSLLFIAHCTPRHLRNRRQPLFLQSRAVRLREIPAVPHPLLTNCSKHAPPYLLSLDTVTATAQSEPCVHVTLAHDINIYIYIPYIHTQYIFYRNVYPRQEVSVQYVFLTTIGNTTSLPTLSLCTLYFCIPFFSHALLLVVLSFLDY